jgi:hypothetical protein
VKRRAQKIGLEAGMALAAVNIWTGSPLLALWIGARVATSTRPSMSVLFVIAAVMFGTSLALIAVLNRLSLAHDQLTGRPQMVRRHVPWLRSMRAERVEYSRGAASLTTLDRIIVGVVVLAVVLFEAWFFLASPSPIEPGPAKD